MPPAASEVSRDELLTVLRREGLRVSRHQLLRWHDWGLLPQPRREGLGRGKGTASYYPKPAVLQARTLARLLASRRNLVDAGWGLWALGFPVTAWARDLLLEELELQEAEFIRADQDLRRGRGPLAEAAEQSRPPRSLARMLSGVRREATPRLFQMLVAYPLGTLQDGEYSVPEWELFRDALLRAHWPSLLDDEDLPDIADVIPAMSRLSRELSFRHVIEALTTIPDARLEQYRNELQWLVEVLAAPGEQPTAVMSRSEFLAFFKVRHMDHEGKRGLAQLMKALGQSRPPPSQLQRWLTALQQVGGTSQKRGSSR